MKATNHTIHHRLSAGGERASWLWTPMARLASVRLTVALLAISFVLVLAATLAQVDQGIWTVIRTYFRVFYCTLDFQLFFPRAWSVPGALPFPGGYTVGGLLFLNLLASFFVGFQLRWRRVGLLLSHLGLMLLFVGEFVTAVYAEEGHMSIDEGGSSSYVESYRDTEMVVIDRSGAETDAVVAVPSSRLVAGARIGHEHLPFDFRVDQWMDNSDIVEGDSEYVGPIRGQHAESRPEASGAAASDRRNLPSAHIEVFDKASGKSLGKALITTWTRRPHVLRLGAKSYEVGLRFRRSYRPFRLELIDFRFDRYMGTDIPMNFSSRVRLVDEERGVDREVLIWMNHPLRYRGETFYQASYKSDETGTVLQAVKNPGWLIPYISCTAVGLGLLIHFLLNLGRFLRGRRRE